MGQNRVGGRWTSEMCQCEGREGVADRQNWKVRWKTWKYRLQLLRGGKVRGCETTRGRSRTAGVRAKEMPGAERK